MRPLAIAGKGPHVNFQLGRAIPVLTGNAQAIPVVKTGSDPTSGLALTRFKAGVSLVDHVKTALATNDLAIAMAAL